MRSRAPAGQAALPRALRRKTRNVLYACRFAARRSPGQCNTASGSLHRNGREERERDGNGTTSCRCAPNPNWRTPPRQFSDREAPARRPSRFAISPSQRQPRGKRQRPIQCSSPRDRLECEGWRHDLQIRSPKRRVWYQSSRQTLQRDTLYREMSECLGQFQQR